MGDLFKIVKTQFSNKLMNAIMEFEVGYVKTLKILQS